MKYIGTRNKEITATASEAILKGICEDGGLFIPDEMPVMDKKLEELVNLDYRELAYEVMKLFLTDFTEEELRYCINSAYDEKFDDKDIAPLKVENGVGILELFHGRTLAFKDMALSILPYLMKTSAAKNGLDKEIVILTATSGDTGKAALEGFANVPGTRIIVFFPEDGVSPVQKLQMVTQEGDNTCVCGILGNFDDAQTAVKTIFTDKELVKELDEKGFNFSSANSINIGRLVPQIVYYFYAYLAMVRKGEIRLGEEINFTVPTGNFGNILAGYIAKKAGLPVKTFICASNENKVLFDFFKTGVYDKNREFVVTTSPSMDILISSNLERLLCMVSGQEKTKALMESLNKDGKYTLEVNENIVGEYATEKETADAIKSLYEKTGYVMDTHTAVAAKVYKDYRKDSGDTKKTVIASTASPYKFAKSVMTAIDSRYEGTEDFDLIDSMEVVSNVPIPKVIGEIRDAEILHNLECDADRMKDTVKTILGV